MKKKVFENGVPLVVSKDIRYKIDSKTYSKADLLNSTIDEVYDEENITGYLSIPIGTVEFMASRTINNRQVYTSNLLYNELGTNYFYYPTFVDIRNIKRKATLFCTIPDQDQYNITGHLVIPIPRAGRGTKFYASPDAEGKIIPPTHHIINQRHTQVVYIPKNTSY